MKWKDKDIKLGVMSPGSSTKFLFELEEGELQVAELITSCTCFRARVDGNTIVGVFNAPAIPYHLRKEGKKRYTSKKKITLVYHNGVREILGFSAVIKG